MKKEFYYFDYTTEEFISVTDFGEKELWVGVYKLGPRCFKLKYQYDAHYIPDKGLEIRGDNGVTTYQKI